MNRVRTAVVPAAGLGTRFLPTTLAVPKELLPLDRRPAIHHIAQEAAAAGIETMVLVLAQGKEGVLHYFLDNPVVESGLKDPELAAMVAEVRELQQRMEFIVVYQQEALGLGHAVLTAAHAVGHEPFALMLPDDNFRPSPLGPLVQACADHGKGGIALLEVADDQVPRYGIVEVSGQEGELYFLSGAVEKPRVEEAPSNFAIMGRYVLPPEIFELLRHTRPGAKGEIQITDALHQVARTQGLLGIPFTGTYLDLGTWEGFVLANTRTALADPALGPRLRTLLAEEV